MRVKLTDSKPQQITNRDHDCQYLRLVGIVYHIIAIGK